MRHLLLSALIILPLLSAAQEKLKIEFDKELVSIQNGHGVMPVWEYTSDTIYYQNEPYTIKLPEHLKTENTAIGLEYFAGWENAPIEDNILIVIENYKSASRRLYADFNNNLDITDDEKPLKADANGRFAIILHNSSDRNARWGIQFSRASYRSEENQKMNEDFFMNRRNYVKNKLVKSDFWMFVKRLDTRVTEVNIGGEIVKIGLKDGTTNGFFNDSVYDCITIAEEGKELSASKSKGAVDFSKEKVLVKIGEQVYRVSEIERKGEYVVLTPTDEKLDRLTARDLLPDYVYLDMNNDTASLHDALNEGGYTLIYSWGSWCKPCTYKLPRVKEIYNAGVNVLGLSYGDSEESAKAYIEKHEIAWKNGFITKEIMEKFYVDRWPYFVLVDKESRIVGFSMALDEIEEMVKRP